MNPDTHCEIFKDLHFINEHFVLPNIYLCTYINFLSDDRINK